MNVFLRELKANRKALIIWSLCMFLLVVSGMSKYTVYSSGNSNELFNKMPYSLKALFGIGSFDVSKMSGFFAFLFPYIEITAAIHAVLLGSGIIAKEERDKTTEFLMVKPISLNTILTSKLLAAFVNVLVLNIVTLISSIVMVNAYNKGKDISSEIMMFILSMLIVQLIFLSLGALLSVFIKNSKASGSAAAGILFGSFMISKITDFTDKINAINILSPFKYFSYQDIVNGNGISAGVSIISLVLIAIFSILTYFFYRKRDFNV
ncbi:MULTISPECIES: ABC transporter permease subunit [Clostridium]|uniref:ABC transporter permease subunit n=1 Tax=Clostridium TaxID=1485 RepID=UPI000826192C|nr:MULTISPECIES: ABC transporter permease subunit [Clostridium]PJI08005.1 ABC transporter [Clostridium sp. CT7]